MSSDGSAKSGAFELGRLVLVRQLWEDLRMCVLYRVKDNVHRLQNPDETQHTYQAGSAHYDGKKLQMILDVQQPSFQSLLLKLRFNGQELATGTGFLVNTKVGPMLITNRHNVTGRHQADDKPMSPTGGVPNEVEIIHNHENGIGVWISKVEALYSDPDNEIPCWSEHPTLGPRADFVCLPLTDVSEIALYPFDLENPGPDILIAPADVVSVIGFPFGLTAGGCFAIWATGFIASEPDLSYEELPIQLIDCRSRPGQSGSPVLAQRNGGAIRMKDGGTSVFQGSLSKLIGIYSGRVNAESDLGIVWKTSAILELIRSVESQVSQT